ncbi:MAG: peptide deformylase [Bacteroidota bacterium]|nr:peptide deformylase [Bacteroidota bacterium]
MSVLPIYLDGTKPLRKKAKPVSQIDDSTLKFIMDMFETMHSADGIGLAANQVGVLQRIIVVDVSFLEEYEDVKPFALINPEVISEEGKCSMEEGCLSVPDVRGEIERPQKIVVNYKDTKFKDQQIVAEDLLARVILHELDHLNGVLFVDYLTKSKKQELKEAIEKIQNGEVATKYPVVTTQRVIL